IVSPDAWIFILYVTVFRYIGWSFVPILALQGVLFGRVAGYLEPRFRYLADFGAFVLFAVAATTTGVVLQSPGVTAFSQAWNLGFGILPAAAHLFLGNRVTGIVREAGIVDLRDGLVRLQEFRDGFGVVAVFLHADCEGLDPAQCEPTVERARNGAERILGELELLVQVVPVHDEG